MLPINLIANQIKNNGMSNRYSVLSYGKLIGTSKAKIVQKHETLKISIPHLNHCTHPYMHTCTYSHVCLS